MQEVQVQSLDWEDPLEEEMATHSSILAWKISWMEEPGRVQSMRSQRVTVSNMDTTEQLSTQSSWGIHEKKRWRKHSTEGQDPMWILNTRGLALLLTTWCIVSVIPITQSFVHSFCYSFKNTISSQEYWHGYANRHGLWLQNSLQTFLYSHFLAPPNRFQLQEAFWNGYHYGIFESNQLLVLINLGPELFL